MDMKKLFALLGTMLTVGSLAAIPASAAEPEIIKESPAASTIEVAEVEETEDFVMQPHYLPTSPDVDNTDEEILVFRENIETEDGITYFVDDDGDRFEIVERYT